VDANRWLGYYCQDCLDETRRLTVFTPALSVPAPAAWWLLGLGMVGLAARLAVVKVRATATS
jgi:hypothetical protein